MKLELDRPTHSSSTAYSSRRKRQARAASVTSTQVAPISSHGVSATPSSAHSMRSAGTYSSTAAGRQT